MHRICIKIILGMCFQNPDTGCWKTRKRANNTCSVKTRSVTPLQLRVSREEGQIVQPCAIVVVDQLHILFTIL